MNQTSPAARELAVITGASSGIGQVFARALARQGRFDLLLVARRTDRLNALASELHATHGGSPDTQRFSILTADLTTEPGLEALIATVNADPRPLGLLVNNAGFGHVGTFLSSSPERDLEMVRLNCAAPLRLMHALLPKMRAAGRGTVLNVCSVVSFLPLAYMSTYAATKAFLLSLSLSTDQELRGSGVRVLALCPGPTESEFHIAAGLNDALDVFPSMTAEKVVEQALRGVARGRAVTVNGVLNSLSAFTAHLVGPRFAAVIGRPIMRRYLALRGVPVREG